MKLKVGDKVRIRKDLEVYESYGNASARPSMKEWFGKTVTVSFVDRDGDFKIEEGGKRWYWTPEMVEKIVKRGKGKLIFRENATILLKDGNQYVSKCQSGDTYDREKGLLLCLAKANGYTYNDICEMLNNAEYQGEKPDAVKSNGVREVKRPAKVGEYVKVVNAYSYHANDYTNGDILKIIREENGIIRTRYYYKNERYKYITEPEYVVLENYKPYKITLSEFWANKGKKEMAIYCKTEAESRELLTAFDRMGKKWCDDSSYIDFDKIEDLLDECCYYNNNTWSCYKNNGEIYEFNEVDLSK